MIIGLNHILLHIQIKNQYLHDQHLVLNREWWNKLGSPNLFKLKFTDFERTRYKFMMIIHHLG